MGHRAGWGRFDPCALLLSLSLSLSRGGGGDKQYSVWPFQPIHVVPTSAVHRVLLLDRFTFQQPSFVRPTPALPNFILKPPMGGTGTGIRLLARFAPYTGASGTRPAITIQGLGYVRDSLDNFLARFPPIWLVSWAYFYARVSAQSARGFSLTRPTLSGLRSTIC